MNPVRYIFLNQGLGMSSGKLAAQAAHAEMLATNDYYNEALRIIEDCGGPGGTEVATNPTLMVRRGRVVEIEADRLGPWLTRQKYLHNEWVDSGHYTKLVLKAQDSTAMHTIKHYLEARGYRTYLVIDEGRTEIDPFSPTALAVELVDKDDEKVGQHFGEFKLYRDKRRFGK
jgi:peptidyl-tRNA hydrolase